MSRYYRTANLGDLIVLCLLFPLWLIMAAVDVHAEIFGIVDPEDERLGKERKP